MKMLLSSTDDALVRRVRGKLDDAGLPSTIRVQDVPPGTFGVPTYTELWVPANGMDFPHLSAPLTASGLNGHLRGQPSAR